MATPNGYTSWHFLTWLEYFGDRLCLESHTFSLSDQITRRKLWTSKHNLICGVVWTFPASFSRPLLLFSNHGVYLLRKWFSSSKAIFIPTWFFLLLNLQHVKCRVHYKKHHYFGFIRNLPLPSCFSVLFLSLVYAYFYFPLYCNPYLFFLFPFLFSSLRKKNLCLERDELLARYMIWMSLHLEFFSTIQVWKILNVLFCNTYVWPPVCRRPWLLPGRSWLCRCTRHHQSCRACGSPGSRCPDWKSDETWGRFQWSFGFSSTRSWASK